MSVRIEDNEEITTTYYREYGRGDSLTGGWMFPSDEHGNVNIENLNPLAAENYRKCVSGEHEATDLGVRALEHRVRLCNCGSGKYPEELLDGHGIYLCKVCEVCKPERVKGFRSDIFESYDVDEPIDEE